MISGNEGIVNFTTQPIGEKEIQDAADHLVTHSPNRVVTRQDLCNLLRSVADQIDDKGLAPGSLVSYNFELFPERDTEREEKERSPFALYKATGKRRLTISYELEGYK